MTYQRRPLAVRAFTLATRVAGAIAALPNRLMPPPFRLLQIGSAYWQSRALYVAARLDLATILGDGTRNVVDVAREAGADADALNRLMRLLAAMGVFDETGPGLYRNNRLSDGLRTDRKGNVRAMVLMHNSPELTRPWCEALEAGVRTGEVPFEQIHKAEFYAYMDAHPDFDRLFAQAMDCVEALAGDAFATDFDWGRFARVADVGGSNGVKAAAIVARHPQLQALVVDRPQVIRNAISYWAARGGTVLRFLEGDVFTAIPEAQAGDVYLLSAVLHGFGDADCVRALATVARAAGKHAPIVVMEFVMPDRGADIAAASFDMQMFMATRGRERTRREWQALFDQAGVALVETVGMASFGKLMVLEAK